MGVRLQFQFLGFDIKTDSSFEEGRNCGVLGGLVPSQKVFGALEGIYHYDIMIVLSAVAGAELFRVADAFGEPHTDLPGSDCAQGIPIFENPHFG